MICQRYVNCALQNRLSKHDLANVSARAERHIGTQGGGMDQAIAFLGKSGNSGLYYLLENGE